MKNLVVGLVLGLMIGWGGAYLQSRKLGADVARLHAQADSITVALAADSARRDSSEKAQARHDATANAKSKLAEDIRLGAIVQRVPAVCLTPSAPKDSSTLMVPLADFMAVKDAWEAERTARLHAEQVLIPDMRAELATTKALLANRDEVVILQAQRIRALEWRGKLTAPIGVGVGALVVLAVIMVAR